MSWEEFGEKMEKGSKVNQKLFSRMLKSLRREKSGSTMQIKNKELTSELFRWVGKNLGEKIETGSKANEKLFPVVLTSLRRDKSRNTKQIKNEKEDILREEKEIMNKWKQYFEEPWNVKCERQAGDDEEKDIGEQKEEMCDEGIRIEEVIEAIHMLKREKAAGQDNITAEMLQNMREMDLKCWLNCGRKRDFQKIGK